MKSKVAVILVCAVSACSAQRKDTMERPARHAVRGVRGAVAAGSDYAAEAGMRTYFHGGNAVDAGVATMFAASISEFSHFGMGGEAPILIRSKDGKMHAIAGVGTMPKLANADLFRARKPLPGEVRLQWWTDMLAGTGQGGVEGSPGHAPERLPAQHLGGELEEGVGHEGAGDGGLGRSLPRNRTSGTGLPDL